MSDTQFDTFLFVIRGTGAADYTGLSGAEQFEACYKNGTAGSVAAASTSLIVGSVDDRINYGQRDGSTSVYFDGYIADVCVWQGWRPTAAERAMLDQGIDPQVVNSADVWLYRSFRAGTTAEVGNTTLTAAGTAPTLDSTVQPPLTMRELRSTSLLESAALSVSTLLSPADLRSATRLDAPALTAYATIQPADLRSATRLDAATIQQPPVVLDPDEDAEIVNVSSCTVTSVAPGEYVLRLAPDNQADISGWINIVARVVVAGGTLVRLEADLADHQFGLNDGVNNGWCYYDVTAGGHTYATRPKWATNRQLTADFGFIRGDLPVEAVVKTYLVALQPVWKEAFDATWMAELRTRSHVHEAASVAAARAIDPTLPANAHARVSPGTRTQANSVATADAFMLAVRITDTANAPFGGKRRAVLVMGQHASEHQGNYAAHEFTDWLTTLQSGVSETLRQRLLKNFDWHLYNGNPLGRRYGKERWTEEAAGDEDPNRAWDDSGSSQINALRSAIAADAGGFHVLLDFHGAASRNTATWNDAFMLFPNDAGGPADPTPFFTRMAAKLGTFQTSSNDATSEFAQGWAYDNGAIVAETMEYAMGGPGYLDVSGEVRITYGIPNGYAREVLDEMYADGVLGAYIAAEELASATRLEFTVLAARANVVPFDLLVNTRIDPTNVSVPGGPAPITPADRRSATPSGGSRIAATTGESRRAAA